MTSGSEAGHSTVGNGIVFGFLTGCFNTLAVPASPEAPSTVTPFAAAEMNACHRFNSAWVLPNDSSAAARLWEITFAR